MSESKNRLNNNLGNNILIFLLIIFIVYILYCEYKNKENFKQMNEKINQMSEKFTDNKEEITITESIKNLGILAEEIYCKKTGVLNLSGLDVSVNSLTITGDIDDDNNKKSGHINFDKEDGRINFKNGSFIKEWKENGIELWPKKLFTNDEGKIKTKSGEVHIKVDNGKVPDGYGVNIDTIKLNPEEITFKNGSVIKEEDGTEGVSGGIHIYPKSNKKIDGGDQGIVVIKNSNSSGSTSFQINSKNGKTLLQTKKSDKDGKKDGITELYNVEKIQFKNDSIIQEHDNGLRIFPKKKGGRFGRFNIAFSKTDLQFEEAEDPKYLMIGQTNKQPSFYKWGHFQNIGWDKKHN